jgi:hypothetical protein
MGRPGAVAGIAAALRFTIASAATPEVRIPHRQYASCVEFEVEPTRVANGSKLLPIISAAAIIVFLGVGIVAGERGMIGSTRPVSAPPSSARLAMASAAPASAAADAASVGASGRARPFDPALVHCHGLSRAECIAIARAATGEVQATGTTTDRVDVWPTILCSDVFDCPPETLYRLEPLGSAVVHVLGRRTVAWVNVGAVQGHVPPHVIDPPPEAWIVRWFY